MSNLRILSKPSKPKTINDFSSMEQGVLYVIKSRHHNTSNSRVGSIIQRVRNKVFTIGGTDSWEEPNNFSDYQVKKLKKGTTLIID